MAGTRKTTKKTPASGRPATGRGGIAKFTKALTKTTAALSIRNKGKRKAENDSAGTAPKAKKSKRSPPATATPDDEAETEEDPTLKVERNADLVIVARFEVTGHDTYESVTEISADFFLRNGDGGAEKNIGSIITDVVTKSFKDDQGVKEWIKELLTPKPGEAEIDEVSKVFRTLFDIKGAPQKSLTKYRRELSAGRNMFIHTFQINEPYRGLGIAQIAMQAFFQGIANLSDDNDYEGPIVLSPAADADARDAMQAAGTWTDEASAEAGLIRSWGKSGFEVWLRGEADVEGSVTVMGIGKGGW